MSMRWRIFLSFLLVILVAVLSLALFAYFSTTQQVSTFLTSGGLWGVEKNVEQLEEFYRQNESWVGVTEILSPNPQGRGVRQHGSQESVEGNRTFGLRLVDADGYLVLDQKDPDSVGSYLGTDLQGALPVIVEGETVGYVLPESGFVFPSVDVSAALLELLLPSSITAAIVAAVVGLVLAGVLGFFLFRPIQELERAAQGMARGDLTQRVAESGPSEIATLGKTFNSMAGELEKADTNRRNMTADIAHELRTPLAVQQATLEAMLDGVYSLDEENIQVVLDQNRTLRLLVDDLRLLSLVDAGELSLIKKPIELVGFLKDIINKFNPRLQTKEVCIETNFPEDEIDMISDALRIEQILVNILQNALTYSPPNGTIYMTTEKLREVILIRIRDEGEGIPSDLLPVLFERFSKGNKEDRQNDSTGLGLALSKRLAQVLGGDVTARNHPQGGAEFTLTFDVKS